jgi:hypothetical protein
MVEYVSTLLCFAFSFQGWVGGCELVCMHSGGVYGCFFFFAKLVSL